MLLARYNNILNIIKLAYAKKRLIIHFKLSKNDLDLLILFKQLGVIRNYRFHKFQGSSKKYIQLSLHYYQSKPFWLISKTLIRASRYISITYYALRLLHYRLGLSTLILATNSGIMTSHVALKKKIGGLILFFLI